MTIPVPDLRWAVSHFHPWEFLCKCGCGAGPVLMQEEFLQRLDRLRELCAFPLTVASGYRCPTWNQKVSTTGERGPHTTGRAVDISCSRHRAHELLRLALLCGFTGIGVSQRGEGRFIHLDDLQEPEHAPRPTVWSYP